MVQALAAHEDVDVHVVTQIRNREAILRAGWREGRDFTALDTERVAGLLWKFGSWLRGGAGKGWTMLTALSTVGNYHFENEVWNVFGSSVRRGDFDVVHRVTPVSPTTPSLLASDCRRAGVPFVLGPLNGGIAWPAGFEKTRWQEREWLSYFRNFYKLMYGYRSTREDASALLIGSQATFDQLPAKYHQKSFYMPENAIDPRRFPPGSVRSPRTPIRAVFLGRLVPYKGCDILLDAAAPLLQAKALELTIVGDGPQRESLQNQVDQLGVRSQVKMTGWVAHEEVCHHLADADVFTFPSLREFGGGAVLEAMASGLPPVVVDYGGPGELVTDRTGWKVPIGPRAQIVFDLRRVLERVCAQPQEIQEKSQASLRRAYEQFTWEAKANQVVNIYRWVLGQGAKPVFAMPTPDVAETLCASRSA